ncbi:MAG: prepilin-type N-terminal cleavage/methylation domain-containing protein, partial [Verrucomicrobiae bacterium]|nr:prepilin-type N-terminal cleavage/methylation domain-containing protein [Verrucomicrobiae bacterium]
MMMNPPVSSGRRAAFTLLEMLVAMTVLVIIIFGLYAMFAQTQKAFRNVSGQVDVFEGGRAAIDLISRDVAQAMAAGNALYPHFDTPPNPVIISGYVQSYADGLSTNFFTNRLQGLYLMSRSGELWNGTGYYVHTNLSDQLPRTNGFGVLYRFSAETNRINTNAPMVSSFYNANPNSIQSNSYVVADGVVHFAVRAFDDRGREITSLTNAALSGSTLPVLVEVEENQALGSEGHREDLQNLKNQIS